MAKQRFRDTKKGKITVTKEKKRSQGTFNFAKRRDILKAFVVDSFMLLMPILYIVIYFLFSGREGFAQHRLLGWLYILIPLIVVETLFLVKSGQTPGMKAYGIKLIFLPTSQKPPLSTIILRQILSKFTFLLFGWIVLFFRKDGRNLHDLIVGTAFVNEDSNSE